jgi:hypothetical protein
MQMHREIEVHTYSAGDSILRQGESIGQRVFLLIQGQAELLSTSPSLEEGVSTTFSHATCRPGETGALMGVCEVPAAASLHTGYNVSVVAQTDAACLSIPRKYIDGPEASDDSLQRSRGEKGGEGRAGEGGAGDVGTGEGRTGEGETREGETGEGETGGRARWKQHVASTLVLASEPMEAVLMFLKTLPLFRGVGQAGEALLSSVTSQLFFRYVIQGQHIISRGECGERFLYVLYRGKAVEECYCARRSDMMLTVEIEEGHILAASAVPHHQKRVYATSVVAQVYLYMYIYMYMYKYM